MIGKLIVITVLLLSAIAFHYVTYASECDSKVHNCEVLKM
jgi:hypothetical protein